MPRCPLVSFGTINGWRVTVTGVVNSNTDDDGATTRWVNLTVRVEHGAEIEAGGAEIEAGGAWIEEKSYTLYDESEAGNLAGLTQAVSRDPESDDDRRQTLEDLHRVARDIFEYADFPAVEVGDYIEGGEPGTEEYDRGRVVDVNVAGDRVLVAWDRGQLCWAQRLGLVRVDPGAPWPKPETETSG